MRFSRLNGNLFDTIARFIPRETKRLYGSIYLVTDRNFFHDRYFEIFPPTPSTLEYLLLEFFSTSPFVNR